MNKILEFINGKKTMIGAALMFILGGLLATKVISREEFESYMAMAAAFTAVGFRSAISKIEK